MVFQNNLLAGASGATGAQAPFDSTLIGNSVWLDGSSDQLEMAKTSGGSASSKFTVSCWIKRNKFAEGTFSGIFNHFFSSNTGAQLTWLSADTLTWIVFSSTSGAGGQITSSNKFRDIAWYHILANYDGTNGRMELFVNGKSVGVDTFTASSTNPIGSGTSGAAYYWGAAKNTQGTFGRTNSYLAQCALELGTAAVPSDYVDTFTFGTNGSQVIPKATSDLVARINSAGGHSHLLDFSTSSDLGNDASSNNNDFTATSMGSANQSLNSPSKVYTTWNALDSALDGHNTDMALSEGNTVTENGNGAFCRSTFSIPEGLFSYRVTVDDSENHQQFGVALNTAVDLSSGTDAVAGLYTVSASNGQRNTNGSGSSAVSGYSWSDGDTMEVYVSRSGTTYKIWYGKNGTLLNNSSGSQGDPSAGTNELFSFTHTEDVFFGVHYVNSGTKKATTDFGQRGYSPAEGALTLSSNNIPAPTYQGIDYFDATIYEGNGTGQRVGDFVPFTDVYTVDNSAMFENDDAKYLSRTIEAPSAGAPAKKGTWSVWYKTALLANTDIVIFDNGTTATNRFSLNMDFSGQIVFSHKAVTILKTGTSASGYETDFKGDGAWHNIVLKVDTSLPTATDRAVMFIDGVEQTTFQTDQRDNSNFTQNDEIGYMDEGATQFVGSYNGSSSNQWDGYLAEAVFLDNEFLDASSFGQLDTSTNRWVPKDVSGLTFGNCGFYLEFQGDFSSTSLGNDAGKDSSGNNNHFAQGGTWAASDKFTDTPSKNYAVYDTVKGSIYTAMSMSKGHLTTKDGNGSVALAAGFPIQDGYWYYEVNTIEDVNNMVFGLYNPATTVTASTSNPSFSGLQVSGGTVVMQNNGGSNSAAGPTLSNPSAGDVVGIYIRKVKNSYGMWFSLNGTAMNNTPAATETATPDISFAASIELVPAAHYSNPGTKEAQTNFGQLLQFDGGATSFNAASDGYWKHAPVTGFKALNQDNLDDTASKITALAWIKNRDADDSHILVDRVRGTSKVLHSNNPGALETTEPNAVQRFLQRGVQLGSDVQVNTANESYVLWQWLVGNSATTGTANDSGTINSTVIAADAGNFSVGTYTGQTSAGTVGHGLGGAPEMIIIWDKEFDNSVAAYHEYIATDAETDYILLNSAGGLQDNATFWNDTVPNSTVFSVGTGNNTNGNGRDKLFLAFRSVAGVCKVGSWTGNGDTNGDGPYISLGFQPRFFMFTNAASQNWVIWDSVQDTTNPVENALFADLDSVVSTTASHYSHDNLADGIKIRGTSGHAISNATGAKYIYIAMANIAGGGTLPPIYGR